MRKLTLALTLALALPVAAENVSIPTQPAVVTNVPVGSTAVTCVLTTTNTTSTQVTGCEVVAGKIYYITDVVIAREAANAVSTPTILQSGTSTACTGPAVLLSTYGVALSTTSHSFRTPLVATVSHGLCILDGTTGTKKITVTGYYK